MLQTCLQLGALLLQHFPVSIGSLLSPQTKKPIVVYPNESKTITGMVRRTSHYENAVTENIDESNDLNICPCVVAVKANSKTARIPVRVCNISARPFTIKPRSQLCSLQEVNNIKTMDQSCDSVSVGSSSKSFED